MSYTLEMLPIKFKISPVTLTISNCLLAIIICISAIQYPALSNINALYIITIIIAYWLPKPKQIGYFAILSTMLTILVTTWQHNLWSSAYFINLLITIAIIWSTTVFAIHHKINNSLVTTNPQLEEQLLWLACHDDLTGIYNRRYFNQQIAIEWERLKRSKTPLALLILDIDYFKQYNDTLGHPAGDNCLKLVAEAIRQTVNRGGDVVARYGGEEFVLLLPNTAEHGAQHIANKLHQAIAALNIASPYPETPSQVTISTGISVMLPTAAGGYDVLLKQADHALYQAKYAGRNCYRFYTEAI